jgi:hypothetical protein
MSYPSNFGTLQQAVLQKARLDEALDGSKVQDWINQAYFRIAVEVEFFQAGVANTPPLVATQMNVTVPAQMIGINYIVPAGSDGSTWGPMEEIGFQELFELRAWQGGSVPLGAPSRYAFNSNAVNTIEFWPQASGGEVLTFYGYQLPTQLNLDTDFPLFPEPYASKCLEYGALCDACEFKKDIFMLNQYQGEFQDWLQRFRTFTNGRRGDRVMAMPVDKQRPYPRGNSVDTGIF